MILAFLKRLFGKYKGGFDPEKQDDRDFEITSVGGWFGFGNYEPKHKKHIIPVLGIKDQSGQRSCVCESACTQKENHEGVSLSPQMLAAYLRSTGEMTSRGTSLSASQNAVRKVGICRKGLTPGKYNVPWSKFSNPDILTNEVMQDAATHKSKTFFKTSSVDKVLEELDKDNMGQTASAWKSNVYHLRNPWIVGPETEGRLDYHAYSVVGYNLDYFGEKVFICANSMSINWGNDGFFYIRFIDFSRFLKWGVYFQSDLPKNHIGWLSIHQQQAVIERDGHRIYMIHGDVKRHIPDMPMLHMLGKLTSFMVDKDNMLPEIKEGEPITINDISKDRVKEVREQVRLLRDAQFLSTEYKEYFPDLF